MLGDVEIRHDLDARDKRGLIGGVEGTQRAHEHAIDAEIYRHAIGAGMDMNVARLLLQRGADRLVDEPYDRSRIPAEGFEIDDLAAALPGFANERQPELGGDVLKDFVPVVALLQQLLDGAGGADHELDLASAEHAEPLLQLEIVRPARRDGQHIAPSPERRHAKPPCIGGGQTLQRLRRDSHTRQIVERQAVFGGGFRGHATPVIGS